MASPSSVLTRGYGSWGSVNLLPTLGYGVDSFEPVVPASFVIVAGQVACMGSVAAEVACMGAEIAETNIIGAVVAQSEGQSQWQP